MSVRKIISANDYSYGNALGYSDKLGNKKVVDRSSTMVEGATSQFDYWFNVEPKFVSISGAVGDTVLVSGITNRQLQVDNYVFSCGSNSNVSFRSGSTFLTGPMTVNSGVPVANDEPSLRTGVGEDLIINSTGSTIHGSLTYKIL